MSKTNLQLKDITFSLNGICLYCRSPVGLPVWLNYTGRESDDQLTEMTSHLLLSALREFRSVDSMCFHGEKNE